MITEPAPILLFCYKRLNVLKCTIEALQNNELANESELFIFSDGAKVPGDEAQIENVRAYLKKIQGFKSVQIFEAATNQGLANSIINGVTKMFEVFDKVIVLEDDLVTSTNFLSYMNQALNFYEKMNVFSVAGFSFPVQGQPTDTVYFTKRASSWGWATWKNRWENVDWEVKNYFQLKQSKSIRRDFNRMGTDLAGMLDKQMKGQIDSWAIRWCYHQFKQESFTVHPAVSKVVNIGFGEEATHTNENSNRYKTILDCSGQTSFSFKRRVELDPQIIGQITKNYSIRFRAYYKLQKLLSKYIGKKIFL